LRCTVWCTRTHLVLERSDKEPSMHELSLLV
jgi:hypothetical protein